MKIANLLVFLILLLTSIAVQAQWQDGNLAVKTNGTVFKSGEQLKVEIIALEAIPESFYTQVSYSYQVKVKKIIETEKDGMTTKEEREVEETVVKKRKENPLLLKMDQHQTQLLDSTYHFGDTAPEGCITVNVDIFRADTKESVTRLNSCVCYEDLVKPTGATFLRSLKRVNNATWVTFDGLFSLNARYSALIMRDSEVVQHLRAGVTGDEKELNITAFEFNTLSDKTYDVLVHDHNKGNSSTVAKINFAVSK
jgi:hypothetical protein